MSSLEGSVFHVVYYGFVLMVQPTWNQIKPYVAHELKRVWYSWGRRRFPRLMIDQKLKTIWKLQGATIAVLFGELR